MPWFKVDDAFHTHPKVLALRTGPCEDTAVALWAKAGSWCAANLTDGAVPSYVLDTFVRKNAVKAADELVRVRLWEKVGNDYAFRSWAEYQPTAAEVRAEREASKKRLKEWRAKQKTNAIETVDETPFQTPLETVTPTRPDPTDQENADAFSARDRAKPKHIARFEDSFRASAPEPTRDMLSFADVENVFSLRRKAAGGAPYRNRQHRDDSHLEALAEAANASAPSRGARLAALRDGVDRFAADPKAREAGCPIGWMAADPERWLTAPADAQTTTATSPLAAAHAEAQEAVRVARARRDDPEEIYRLEQIEAAAMRAMLEPPRRPS